MSSKKSKSDLKKLLMYAKTLDISVEIKPATKDIDFGGYYSLAERLIVIYRKARYTDTDICLLLLHELAHHRDWVHKGKKETAEIIDALQKQEEESKGVLKLTKSERSFIKMSEYDGVKYMPVIAKELDLKMPMYKVYAEAELDMHSANKYYMTGNDLTVKQCVALRKKLRNKYKKMSTPVLETPK